MLNPLLKLIKQGVHMKRILLTLLVCLSGVIVNAQNDVPKIDAAEKKLIIDSVSVMLKRSYIFEDVAVKMTDLILKKYNDGGYNAVDNPMEFGRIITDDLRSVCKDKHLTLLFAPFMIKMERDKSKGDTNAANADLRRLRDDNYGFKEIKILPGNVGYLKFNAFRESQEAMQTAIGAMNFLANTGALIIDLRDNGGGSATMIQLISSYFFGGEPVHLNSFYYRENNLNEQTWTLPYVPGRKLLNTDLYILTSNYTFSAAEEFTYNLKNLKRATIIGETTGGGAHPVKDAIINDHFMLMIPYGRAINPIPNTNWEGTGIEPHVSIARSAAYDTAYLIALDKLMEKEKDERYKTKYKWIIDGAKAKLNPSVPDLKTMKSYAGVYGARKITFENGALFYQRVNGPKLKMIPMSVDYFMFSEVDYFRLKILKENDKVIGLEGRYDDGRTDKTLKSDK